MNSMPLPVMRCLPWRLLTRHSMGLLPLAVRTCFHSCEYWTCGLMKSAKAFSPDLFWQSFAMPFIDSLGFIDTLAAKIDEGTGHGLRITSKNADHEAACATTFGPHGLHRLAEGLMFMHRFQAKLSPSIWSDAANNVRSLTNSSITLIHNFYRDPEGPEAELYCPQDVRQFVKTVSRCNNKPELTVRLCSPCPLS